MLHDRLSYRTDKQEVDRWSLRGVLQADGGCPELGADFVRELFVQATSNAASLFNTIPVTFSEFCVKEVDQARIGQ